VGDYINVPGSSTMHFTTGGFTLSAWVAVDSHPVEGTNYLFVAKHIAGYPNGYFLGMDVGRFAFLVGVLLELPGGFSLDGLKGAERRQRSF
jgi:hypothetical protein